MYNVQTNKNPKDLKDVRLRVITNYIVAMTELYRSYSSRQQFGTYVTIY